MPAPTLPPGPADGATLNPWFVEIQQRLSALEVPQQPKPVYACTKANLPAASGFANCVARITDVGCLAFCDGTHWLRADTEAILK